MALRPPCRVLGAALDDIVSRVTPCLVYSSTFKINSREFTCLLVWSAVEEREEQVEWFAKIGGCKCGIVKMTLVTKEMTTFTW